MKPGNEAFEKALKTLNNEQKQAVDAIEGPIMVIAGPGTGKTQILALRIANILAKTDTQADGILCLTFTKSGVEAMRRRLRSYIGPDAGKIEVHTFHAFGTKIIDNYFHVLGFQHAPKTLEDHETVALFDFILSEHEWQYLRPRGNSVMYYNDLRSLISLVRREGLSPEGLRDVVEGDIAMLHSDPASLSSRGPTKGGIKKEILTRIESLERTKEAAKFFELYEAEKRERNVMDYDDILAHMTEIVRESEDARAEVREQYLYVLVDEHQDSSGIQNEFLKIIWGNGKEEGFEKPNIFVVGDDRQLIYGFGGASLSHFQEFTETFPGTQIITLIENYRSTQTILDTADKLLESVLASGKLRSQHAQPSLEHPIALVEADYPRDEIIQAGMFFREKIFGVDDGKNRVRENGKDHAEKDGALLPKNCALLVPKKAHVRSAVTLLRDMGLPVSSVQSLRLFDTPDAESFITILKIIHDPYATVSLAEILLDPVAGIPPLEAHKFIHEVSSRKMSVEMLVERESLAGLFADPIGALGNKLEKVIKDTQGKSLYSTIQIVGDTFLLQDMSDHDIFVRRVEVVRSMLHLALGFEQKNPRTKLGDFIAYIDRLREYGEQIPLAIFGSNDGIQVLTLHGSKGLEFDAVWIAHLNERSLMGSKRLNFTLPEKLAERVEKKDAAVAKRELYVAITRAKVFCTLSYAKLSCTGSEERIASIVDAMPDGSFEIASEKNGEKNSANGTGGHDASEVVTDPLMYVASRPVAEPQVTRDQLRKLVAENYPNKKVSVTLLNNFYDCPWKWYFKSFLEVPEPLSASLQFGSIVHGTLERVVKHEDAPNQKTILSYIVEEIANCHVADKPTVTRFTKEAQRAVERFVENEFPNLWEMRESEKSLSFKDEDLPDLRITGKIDLLEHDNGESVRVTDFKTGKPKTARDIEKLDDEGRLHDYLRQLAMYSYLFDRTQNSKPNGNHSVETSRLYFMESTDAAKTIYQTTVTEDQIELLRKDMIDYDSFMKSGEWTERACHWKSYGGTETECPYCKMAKMYK